MPAQAKRRRRPPIRFRLTAAGWMFLGVSVLVGLVAVKSQAALLFILFGGMMGALHMSAVLARRTIAVVRLRREVPDRVWQNQTVHLGYTLRNTSRRVPGLALEVEELTPEGIDSAAGYCIHLPAGMVFRAGSRFAASRRGRVRLSGVRLSTRFPFGLVRAHQTLRHEADVVIWPAKGLLRSELLRRGAVESSTSAPSLATGGQDEFFGLREYRQDDHPRWIHWRRSAGRDVPVIREMARPLPEELWVLLDATMPEPSDVAREDREQRIRFAATLIDQAFRRGYKVGLAAGSGAETVLHAPRAGRGHRRKLLDALADIQDSQVGPAEMVSRFRRGMLRQAQVVLVTSNAKALDADAVHSVRGSCRSLSVLDRDMLHRIYEDNPHIDWGRADAA